MKADADPYRIAIIATIYRYLSHAQHFGDRFLVGYPYEGRWRHPDVKVVSLYVDQRPDGGGRPDSGPAPQRRAAAAGRETGGLLHRVSRRPFRDAADVERRAEGL